MTENEILRRVARDYNLLCGLTPAVAEWVAYCYFPRRRTSGTSGITPRFS